MSKVMYFEMNSKSKLGLGIKIKAKQFFQAQNTLLYCYGVIH